MEANMTRTTMMTTGRMPNTSGTRIHSHHKLDARTRELLREHYPETIAGYRKWMDRLLIDRVTGLPNYEAFLLEYKTTFARAEDSGLILLDIQKFKRFNDRRGGHERGNQVLREFATCLRTSVKRDDFVARWSVGDEILIAAANLPDQMALQALVQRLKGPFPVHSGRRRIHVTCHTAGLRVRDQAFFELERRLHERLRQGKLRSRNVN